MPYCVLSSAWNELCKLLQLTSICLPSNSVSQGAHLRHPQQAANGWTVPVSVLDSSGHCARAFKATVGPDTLQRAVCVCSSNSSNKVTGHNTQLSFGKGLGHHDAHIACVCLAYSGATCMCGLALCQVCILHINMLSPVKA